MATGFAFGGPDEQRGMLAAEGVAFDEEGRVIMEEFQWDGRPESATSGEDDVPTGPPPDFDWEAELAEHPLIAAVAGAMFVGVGVGLCVRAGGAPGGDDALSMSLEHVTHLPIQWIYLISDLIVLGLSLTYIPLRRILYSLLTVILSGQLIGIVQRAGKREKGSVPSCAGNETVL